MKDVFKSSIISTAAIVFAMSTANAKMPTLTMEAAQPGGSTDVASKNLAEVEM